MLPLPVLIVALGLLSAATVSAEPSCGGALDGDFGSFHFYDSEDSDSYNQICVFVVRLHSTTNLSVTASEVAAGTSVGVFTSEQAASSFPVVPPLFVFNQSTEGSTFRTRFSTAILVLNPSNTTRDFKVQWRGEAPGTGLAPIETANYIDADSGTVEQDDYGLAVLALVLNPSQGDKVDLEIKILGHEEECANVAYSVFALLDGNLREVFRSCGKPFNQTSLPTPLIAFVAKPTLEQSETISFRWRTINVPEEATTSCGGSLQANQGVLQYEDDEAADPSHACAWSLRLQSKSGFRLTLLDLNDGGGVGIFSSAQAGSPFPVIDPTYPLNVSDIGRPLDPIGEILIVILNPSTSRRRFAVSWDGLQQAPAGSPESLTYLDSNEGALTQHDSFLTLVAFILNPPGSWNLNLEVEVLDFEGLCADVAFSTFQVTDVGKLREVVRTCGQSTPPFTNLRPPLISFVVKATQDQSETVRLAWSSVRPPPEDGSTTTPDPTLVESTECGGTLVGSRGVIRYKIQTPYVRDERCVWTIRANLFSQVRLQLVDDGLYTVPGFDYLTISTVPNMDTQQLISTDQIVHGGFRSPFSVRGPVVFVIFRTAQGGPRGFELSFDGEGSNVPNRLFTHLHFNTSLNSNNEFRYPASGNYRDSEFVTLVFNQGLLNLQYRLGLRFDYIDLEYEGTCTYDVLSINEASPVANVDHLNRTCPSSSSTVRTFTSAMDGGTFIVLFKTDPSIVRTGFRGSYSYLRV